MSDEIMRLLIAIDGKLSRLVAQFPEVASDRDLDSQYGDKEIKFDPKDWKGDSMKGRRMSEAPAEFLELLALAYDYFASKSEATGELTSGGKPKAEFDRKAAALARGWAKRNRQNPPKPKDVVADDWTATESPF